MTDRTPLAGERILVVHNFYQLPGGEDEVFRGETTLLEARGHAVSTYTRRNEDVAKMNPLAQAQVSVWNQTTYREIRALIRECRPILMHVHNTLPLISPSVYYAARAEHVPVVQTLHNYRLVCPAATLFRDGHHCEDCLGKRVAWPGVKHACYRGSRGASAVIASMLATHRGIGTWNNAIDVYIALTHTMRAKLVSGGLPGDKVVVKPNFVQHDPGVGTRSGGYILFVGRLDEVKGMDSLLGAWSLLPSEIPLKIVGDGPMRESVRRFAHQRRSVEWLGQQPRERVQQLMREAYALVFPSVWFEPFSLVVLEALAAGTPVIASNLGSMASVVEHERTGLHFRPGDAPSLAATVALAWSRPEAMAKMALEARREYLEKYTPDVNYRNLMGVYRRAIERSRGGPLGAAASVPGDS